MLLNCGGSDEISTFTDNSFLRVFTVAWKWTPLSRHENGLFKVEVGRRFVTQ